MKSVLIVSSHPDDETLGVGGTIVKHREAGDRVTVLIMTDGVTARHNQTTLQQQAALKACNVLGVEDVRFADLPDQRLDSLPLIDIIKPISDLVNDIHPQIVYTHHGGDVNQDHRVVFEATLVATRPVNKNSVLEIYCYEVVSSTEWAPPLAHWTFNPNFYVNITPYLEIKKNALSAYSKTYQTEIPPYPHPRSLKSIEIYANKRGIEVGMEYAEAFMLIRKLG